MAVAELARLFIWCAALLGGAHLLVVLVDMPLDFALLAFFFAGMLYRGRFRGLD